MTEFFSSLSKSATEAFQSKRILTSPRRGFEILGYFRIAYSAETKTIEKALPGLSEATEKYPINGEETLKNWLNMF
jgi:hypothetical protein